MMGRILLLLLILACWCCCAVGDWHKHSILHPPTTEACLFGWGGALSADSRTLMVSGFYRENYHCRTTFQNITSNIWIYQLNDYYTWDLIQQLDYNVSTDPPASLFGSTYISDTGNTVAAIHNNSGTLYIWTRNPKISPNFTFNATLKPDLLAYTDDAHRIAIWEDSRIIVGGGPRVNDKDYIQISELRYGEWGRFQKLLTFVNSSNNFVAMTRDFIFVTIPFRGMQIYTGSDALDRKVWSLHQEIYDNLTVISIYADDSSIIISHNELGVDFYRRDSNNTFVLNYTFHDTYNLTTKHGHFGNDVAMLDHLLVLTLWEVPGWLYIYDTQNQSSFTNPFFFVGPNWGEKPCDRWDCFLRQGYGGRLVVSQFLIASFAGPDRVLYNDTQYFITDNDTPLGEYPLNYSQGSVSIYIDRCRIPGVQCLAPNSSSVSSSPVITIPVNTTVLIITTPVTLSNDSVVVIQQGQMINATQCIQFAGSLTYIIGSNTVGKIDQNGSVVNVINFNQCGNESQSGGQFSSITVQDENECSYPSRGVYGKQSFALLITPIATGCKAGESSGDAHTAETSGAVRMVLLAVLIPVLGCVIIVILVVLVVGLALAYFRTKRTSSLNGDTDL